MSKQIRKVFVGVIKAINIAENSLTAYISTGATDRMNESLDPKGVDAANFKKNPVVLWAHDYSQPPIGKALWVKRDENGILAKVQFAPTEFAKEIFNMFKEGFMKAFSVGFIPKKWVDGNKPNEPRRTYTEWELLEFSAVPVPANPEALALAMQKGILKDETLIEEFKNFKEEETLFDDETIAPEIEAAAEALIEKVVTEQKVDNLQQKGLDELMAENKQLLEQIVSKEKEIADLKYQFYCAIDKKINSARPGITGEDFTNKIGEMIAGVIRREKGFVS